MNELVALGRAITDPTRARILNALRQADLCVCELVDALELSQSTLSTHLQTLRTAGAVATEKRATWIVYRLEPSTRAVVEVLFERFPLRDERAERDLKRIEARLKLRVDGCCVLGSGQLER